MCGVRSRASTRWRRNFTICESSSAGCFRTDNLDAKAYKGLPFVPEEPSGSGSRSSPFTRMERVERFDTATQTT
eukprot:386894-Pleurochrysis_carterae.AAC.2